MDGSRAVEQLSAEDLASRLGQVLSGEELEAVVGGHSAEFAVITAEGTHAF